MGHATFERSDVMEVIDIKPSRVSELLREMAENGVIEAEILEGKRCRLLHSGIVYKLWMQKKH